MKLSHLLPLLLLSPAFELLEGDPVTPGPTVARDGSPRQFDFWVGSWECRTQSGQLSGTNKIEKILNDRVLQENWEDAAGSHGKSFNIYDAVTGLWHQTWVDASGTLLQLDGGLADDGSMVMEGTRPGPNGTTVQHRITWIPMDGRADGGRVNQVWDSSTDGGESWTSVVDLIYSPRAETEPERPGSGKN